VPAPPQAGLWPGKAEASDRQRCRSGCSGTSPRTEHPPPSQLPEKAHQEKAILAPGPRPLIAKPKGPAQQAAVKTAPLKGLQPQPRGLQGNTGNHDQCSGDSTRRHESVCAPLSAARFSESSGCPRSCGR